MKTVVASSETCIGELKLFQAIQQRIEKLEEAEGKDFAAENHIVILRDLIC